MVKVEEENETAREETLELPKMPAKRKDTATKDTPQLLKCTTQRTAGREQMIERSFPRDTAESMNVVGSSAEKIMLVEELRVQFVDVPMPHNRKAPKRQWWHG